MMIWEPWGSTLLNVGRNGWTGTKHRVWEEVEPEGDGDPERGSDGAQSWMQTEGSSQLPYGYHH